MLWLHYLVVIGEILRWSWEAKRYATAAGRRAKDERRQAPVTTNYIYAPSVHMTFNFYGQMPDLQNPPPENLRGPGVPDVLREILRG